jgi:hypothetical protein
MGPYLAQDQILVPSGYEGRPQVVFAETRGPWSGRGSAGRRRPARSEAVAPSIGQNTHLLMILG